MLQRLLSRLLPALAVAAAYAVLGHLSLSVGALFHPNISAIWLPAGLALAWLLNRGPGEWPGIWLGALACALFAGTPAWAAAGIATGNTLEAVAAAVALRAIGFDGRFRHLRFLLYFIAIAVLLAPLVSALAGVGALIAAGPLAPGAMSGAVLAWWLGDGLGALVFAPLCLALLAPRQEDDWGVAVEGAVLLLCMLLTGLVVFAPFWAAGLFPAKYLLIPFAVVMAVRLGQLGASLAALGLCGLVAYAWVVNPLLQADRDSFIASTLPLLQGYIGVTTVLALMIATVIAQRDRNERRLRQSERTQRLRAAELETMLDAVPVGVVLASPGEARELVLNSMARDILRVPEGAPMALGSAWWREIGCHFERGGEVAPRNSLPMWRALAGERVQDDEVELVCEDGSRRQLLANAVPLLDELGHARGAVVALADISALARARQELVLADQVFDHSGEALMILDREDRILRVNHAFSRITGYPEAEVLGRAGSLLEFEPLEGEFRQQVATQLRTRGVWQGELTSRRRSGEAFPAWFSISCVRDASGAPTHYIALFSDIAERKLAEQRMKQLAEHDFLTGLPNRVLFTDRLGQAIAAARRDGGRFALMFLDLDRFKHINDTLGHSIGDKLLQQLAGRLVSCLRAGDTVSRQGGDEFVMLLPGTHNAEGARHLAEKLLEAISAPFHVDAHELAVTGSLGVVLFPDDGDDAEALLRHADLAMYQAKNSGRNNFQFYTEALNRRTQRLMQMEHGLRRALDARELVLFYQPQVRLSDMAVVAFESLLRWPDGGSFVSPAEFIPVAEESGLIVPLGEWVLREACRQLTCLAPDSPLRIAVNVSALQFCQPNFVDVVAAALTDYGVRPAQLELEVTESVVMHDMQDVIVKLEKLRALGVGIAIDDFGKGYSSLAYLKRFPISKLKIDQEFIRDCTQDAEDAAIVEAIITMATSLGLQIVAEGVETEEQLEFLRQRHCAMVQGYLLGRPAPAPVLAEYFPREPVAELG